jgi:signal peptidase
VKAFFTILYYVVALGALGLGLLLVLLQSSLIPGFEVRIVQSGSMEPAISTGSVVVVQAQDTYVVDQVVTFGGVERGSIPTTHRIIGTELIAGELVFITKGDANPEADVDPVVATDIRGRVLLAIPALGYLLDFARQPLGFALLIGLPALLIVVEEAGKIWTAVQAERRRKEGETPHEEPPTVT